MVLHTLTSIYMQVRGHIYLFKFSNDSEVFVNTLVGDLNMSLHAYNTENMSLHAYNTEKTSGKS